MAVPTGYDLIKLPTLGPGQKRVYNQLQSTFGRGAKGLDLFSRLAGGDTSGFEQLEKPAMRQLQEQILPQVAQRYAGQGIRGSSGLQTSLSSAAEKFGESLQSQRLGIQQQALNQLLGLGQQLLGTPTEQNVLMRQPESIWSQLLGSLVGGLAPAATSGIYSLLR